MLLNAKVAAHLILPRYQCAMKGMLFPSHSLPLLCYCVQRAYELARGPITRQSYSTLEDYVGAEVADSRLLTGAAGPNEAIFSLANEIDPRLLMPLSHAEKTLCFDTFRMLNLKIATRYRQQDPSTSASADVSNTQETPTREVSAEQPSQQNQRDSGTQWPVLMLLGSGVLDAFSSIDY